jgi:glycosyltransferase involved in cell wall biosynthesis
MTTRIAFFAPLLTTGGTQRHLQQLLGGLDPRRFATRVYTLRPGGEVEAELRAAGVPVTSLGVGRRLARPGIGPVLVRTARTLAADRIDVVHGYQWRPSLVGVLAARLARVPLVLASKRSLTGDDRAARLAWRVIGRSVDTIVANADALRSEAERLGVSTRWTIIPSGVDVDHFGIQPLVPAAKAALGLDPARPVVGTIGRLEQRKGHAHLLRAATAMLRKANGRRPQILIVGDGPLRGALTDQVRALGLEESVVFTGTMEDVRGALAAMDVFVLPSRAEGLSNALLEAMASARPVVATAVGGTGEVLDGARTGVLVPADDVEALATEVVRVLSEPARAADLGRAARQWVEERFSARAMVAQFEGLYAQRLAARQRMHAT